MNEWHDFSHTLLRRQMLASSRPQCFFLCFSLSLLRWKIFHWEDKEIPFCPLFHMMPCFYQLIHWGSIQLDDNENRNGWTNNFTVFMWTLQTRLPYSPTLFFFSFLLLIELSSGPFRVLFHQIVVKMLCLLLGFSHIWFLFRGAHHLILTETVCFG